MLGSTLVLAHQGGWDEALMVITPVGLFVGLVWLAYRRHGGADGEHPPTDHGSSAS